MSRSDGDKLVGTLLGILGGIALAELLKNLLQKKCQYCNNMNDSNRVHCKFCGERLQ